MGTDTRNMEANLRHTVTEISTRHISFLVEDMSWLWVNRFILRVPKLCDWEGGYLPRFQ